MWTQLSTKIFLLAGSNAILTTYISLSSFSGHFIWCMHSLKVFSSPPTTFLSRNSSHRLKGGFSTLGSSASNYWTWILYSIYGKEGFWILTTFCSCPSGNGLHHSLHQREPSQTLASSVHQEEFCFLYWPWIVGDQLPCLVVHVGETIVEVGAEVSVNIINVKLSWGTWLTK